MSTIPSWCRVGAKVVCVDGKPRLFSTDNLPLERVVYTIRAIEWCDWQSGVSGLGIYLAEIERVEEAGREWPFGLSRFRPLVTLEDDITTYFSELLNVSTPQRVEV